MLKNGFKLEVEALISKDISYVTEQYVPDRLEDRDFLDCKASTHEIHGERGGSVCELRCNIQTAKQASPVQTTPIPPIRASVMTSRR